MSTRREFIFFVTAILVLIFALFQGTKAGATEITNVKILYLDQQTVGRGYTVKSTDESFWLPVLPTLYSEPVTVKIETLSAGTPLPDGKRGMSGSYIYDIKKSEPGVFDKSVIVALKMDQVSSDAVVCFYDRSQKRWRELPTKVDAERKLAIAKTVFPYAEVVVMKSGEVEPEKRILTLEEQLTANSAIVMDQDGNVVFEKNADEVRPVASLTKLVTTAVFLDYNPGWDKVVTIQASDNVGGASIPFQPGDLVSTKNLFYATLVGSKNNAARALMRSTGLSEPQFISEMNKKVSGWGLHKTHFIEPTGLSEYNISTAREMMEISQRTMGNSNYITASQTDWYQVDYNRGEENKTFLCRNTNLKLLERDLYVTGGKTGFTYEAGYNLITRARLTKNSTRELTALVMGAKISMNYEEVYLLLKTFL